MTLTPGPSPETDTFQERGNQVVVPDAEKKKASAYNQGGGRVGALVPPPANHVEGRPHVSFQH